MLWRYGKHRGAAPTGGNWWKLRFGEPRRTEKRKKPLRYGGKSSVFAQKPLFQPLGKLKTLIFCISNPLEARKRGKTASHPRMTGEKQQILGFIHGWRAKNEKKNVSARAENQNHSISAFPPRRKDRKQQKLRFPLEGKLKSPNFYVSPRREKENRPKRRVLQKEDPHLARADWRYTLHAERPVA